MLSRYTGVIPPEVIVERGVPVQFDVWAEDGDVFVVIPDLSVNYLVPANDHRLSPVLYPVRDYQMYLRGPTYKHLIDLKSETDGPYDYYNRTGQDPPPTFKVLPELTQSSKRLGLSVGKTTRYKITASLSHVRISDQNNYRLVARHGDNSLLPVERAVSGDDFTLWAIFELDLPMGAQTVEVLLEPDGELKQTSVTTVIDVPDPSPVETFVAEQGIGLSLETILALEPLGTDGQVDDADASYIISVANEKQESVRLALASSPLAQDGEISEDDLAYVDLVHQEETASVRAAMALSALVEDGIVSAEDLSVISGLSGYHPKLREAVLYAAPLSAGERSFLADNVLSVNEVAALDRAQSVFGIPAFYAAWELEALRPNEVQAVLSMLTFYDPFQTLHDITADPDDPDVEGAELTRTLDLFDVYRGECVYCKGQIHYPSGLEYRPGQGLMRVIEDTEAYTDAIARVGVFQRTKLLNLTHHATVQADSLTPCDLRNLSEIQLLALGSLQLPTNPATANAFGMQTPAITLSTVLTDEQINQGLIARSRSTDHGREQRRNTSPLLVESGQILSPFTHGASLILPGAGCHQLALEVLRWHAGHYIHFLGHSWVAFDALYGDLFPANPQKPPAWASILSWESGNKSATVVQIMRSLNIPAVDHGMLEWPLPGELNYIDFYGDDRDGDIIFPSFREIIHHNFGYNQRIWKLVPLPTNCRFERTGQAFQADAFIFLRGDEPYTPALLRLVC